MEAPQSERRPDAMDMNNAPLARQATDNPFAQSALRTDRLPGLAAILEAFAAALGKETEKFLGRPFTCLVEGFDPVRLFEALGASRGLPTAVLSSSEINVQSFLVFDGQFGWMLIDACFAASTSAADDGRRRPKGSGTRVGGRFVNEVARIAATALTTAFSTIATASFKLQRMETASDVPLPDRQDAPMLAVRIAVKSAAGEGRLVLLFPQSAIGRFRQDLSEPPKSSTATDDPEWTRELADSLSMTPIEMSAVMEDLQLTLADVSAFAVGTVINLRSSGTNRVRLVSSGRDLFWCRATLNDGQYQLEVE